MIISVNFCELNNDEIKSSAYGVRLIIIVENFIESQTVKLGL